MGVHRGAMNKAADLECTGTGNECWAETENHRGALRLKASRAKGHVTGTLECSEDMMSARIRVVGTCTQSYWG